MDALERRLLTLIIRRPLGTHALGCLTGQNQSGGGDWGVFTGECHILFSVSVLHKVPVNGATEG